MPYEDTSAESLKALGNVVRLCLPEFPCNRTRCARCRKRMEKEKLMDDLASLLMGGDK